PAALIRSLSQDAKVTANSAQQLKWTNQQLTALPGATTAEVTSSEVGSYAAIGTVDVQETIVASLNLAENEGVRLTDLHSTSTSANLEDVFLELTGRSYENQNQPAGEGGEA